MYETFILFFISLFLSLSIFIYFSRFYIICVYLSRKLCSYLSLIVKLYCFSLSLCLSVNLWRSHIVLYLSISLSMVLLTVWAFGFIWTIFHRVILVFFATPFTNLQPCPILTVMVKSLTFNTPLGSWCVLFHPLVGISNFYLLEYMMLIESQNICIRLNFWSVLSDDYS